METNHLILDLITTTRRATPAELGQIIAHVSQAPFASYLSRVPKKMRRDLKARGIILPAGKMRSVEWHLLKRIHIEEQWPIGTTEAQFIADLHQAILHPQVQIWTYRYYNQPFAGFLAPSHVQYVPEPEHYIFVAYSTSFSTITTGHQASSITRVFEHRFTDIIQHR